MHAKWRGYSFQCQSMQKKLPPTIRNRALISTASDSSHCKIVWTAAKSENRWKTSDTWIVGWIVRRRWSTFVTTRMCQSFWWTQSPPPAPCESPSCPGETQHSTNHVSLKFADNLSDISLYCLQRCFHILPLASAICSRPTYQPDEHTFENLFSDLFSCCNDHSYWLIFSHVHIHINCCNICSVATSQTGKLLMKRFPSAALRPPRSSREPRFGTEII